MPPASANSRRAKIDGTRWVARDQDHSANEERVGENKHRLRASILQHGDATLDLLRTARIGDQQAYLELLRGPSKTIQVSASGRRTRIGQQAHSRDARHNFPHQL